jgi:hypothetical protein
MTYASAGLIQASDFNNIVGGSAGTQGGGTQLNPVWSTGQGNYGYGQTAVSNVSVSGTVAATNWASLVNTLNSARTHQSGSGSGISAPTAGTTITYLSTLTSAVSTAATNRLSAATLGTLNTPVNKAMTLNAAAGVSATGTVTYTMTFPSVDQARYFWNAGGQLQIAYSSFTNTGGTSRGTSIQTLAQTNFSSKYLYGTSWGARAGTGGTLITDTTLGGYYGLTTGSTSYFRVNSTSYYTGDYFQVNAYTNGTTGSYGANGNIVTIVITAFSATTGSTQPSDSINVTLTMAAVLRYPETTNLTNTWGTVTVA